MKGAVANLKRICRETTLTFENSEYLIFLFVQ